MCLFPEPAEDDHSFGLAIVDQLGPAPEEEPCEPIARGDAGEYACLELQKEPRRVELPLSQCGSDSGPAGAKRRRLLVKTTVAVP